MNGILKAIQDRRSIRAYENRQITDNSLRRCLRRQPGASANNSQPWHFSVVQNAALLKKSSRRPTGLREEASASSFTRLRSFSFGQPGGKVQRA